MKIVVAPDSFKESLTAKVAAASIAKGCRKVFPEASIKEIPLADGGEGFTEALVDGTGGKIIYTSSHDPLMKPITSFYGISGKGDTAIIEVAAASGLQLLKPEERNPLLASSFGTGELIKKAIADGFKKIVLGLGGSATNDGGAGLMQALGLKLLDENGYTLNPGALYLEKLKSISVKDLHPALKEIQFDIACDVSNTLLGQEGASTVYAPQKGASPEMIPQLEAGLKNWSDVLRTTTGKDFANIPGTGAAGGIATALLAFTSSRLLKGFDLIKEITNLEELIANCDLVITGEGSFDSQTFQGKTVAGVLALAQKYNKKILIICGQSQKGVSIPGHLNYSVQSVLEIASNKEDAISNAAHYLEKIAATTEYYKF